MTAKPQPSSPRRQPRISLVIPLYNEEESLLPLCEGIREALGDEGYEVVFVDDGSTDGSGAVLDALRRRDGHVRVLRFSRNFGKSQALAAGFREALGQVIVTLDADLQDDPGDIPRLVAALGEGYDLVSGWKAPRQDPWSKTIPSRLFNWVVARLSGLPLHDFNCGFKAYRRPVIEELRIYGEQHRFIPALAYWKGFRVTEVGVRHQPRRYGRSKFGAGRMLAGLFDLLTVLFLTRFQRKPLHLFGNLGLASFAMGGAINLYLAILWLGGESIGRRPLLLLGVLLMVMGIQFLSLGLLGEMMALATARGREEGPVYEVWEPAGPLEEMAEASRGD